MPPDSFEVLTCLTTEAWTDSLRVFAPESRDIYFLPEYHLLHQSNGVGKVYASLLREGSNALLIPGIRSEIAGTNLSPTPWDIETCNGYGGPIATPGADNLFLSRAWDEWKASSSKQGIVAALFRLHPALHNVSLLPSDAEVRFDRKTVFVDLAPGLQHVWRQAQSRHRNMVNKGALEGTTVRWNEAEDWEDFERFYTQAMERLSAPDRLRFSPAYFKALQLLPGAELAAIRNESRIDAMAVFLFGEIWGHYHLSARAANAPNYATNCLLQAAFERGKAKGLKGIHLGGGRTSLPSDPLLKFKESCGGSQLDFMVARVVCNPSAFECLCTGWKQRTGRAPGWLLGYREPMVNGQFSSGTGQPDLSVQP